MPPPTRTLTHPTRFAQLRKQKKFTDSCTLTGTGIEVGDTVTVTGTVGSTAHTQWVGTVSADNNNGTFDANDLHVRRLQHGAPAAAPGGTENVSVTVTNQDDSTDTSAPVPTPAVPIVP